MRFALTPYALFCCCLSGVAARAPAAEQPHILCIMADDLGWMDLNCQGNGVLRTPQIDGLAKRGVRFANAYAAAPVCSPTRAALITGLAPARLHITQHGADGRLLSEALVRSCPLSARLLYWANPPTMAFVHSCPA